MSLVATLVKNNTKLLGLLEDLPDMEVPELPVWPVSPIPEPDKPLSPAEAARWNDITRDLGAVSTSQSVEADYIAGSDTPIWDELAVERAWIFAVLGHDGLWGPDWIAADFESMWSGEAAARPQAAPSQRQHPDDGIAPPPGFRAPIREHRDRSGMDDSTMERVLAGLRRL